MWGRIHLPHNANPPVTGLLPQASRQGAEGGARDRISGRFAPCDRCRHCQARRRLLPPAVDHRPLQGECYAEVAVESQVPPPSGSSRRPRSGRSRYCGGSRDCGHRPSRASRASHSGPARTGARVQRIRRTRDGSRLDRVRRRDRDGREPGRRRFVQRQHPRREHVHRAGGRGAERARRGRPDRLHPGPSGIGGAGARLCEGRRSDRRRGVEHGRQQRLGQHPPGGGRRGLRLDAEDRAEPAAADRLDRPDLPDRLRRGLRRAPLERGRPVVVRGARGRDAGRSGRDRAEGPGPAEPAGPDHTGRGRHQHPQRHR